MFGQTGQPVSGLSGQSNLIEVFLVKLELERLTSIRGQGVSRAEQALQIENKILKQRLRTLKDNIGILNSMIDHIKIGGSKRSSKETPTKHADPSRPREEDVPDVQNLADDIRSVYQNSQSVKDQNSRLMVVNEKLLNESESLRKEIYRLRNLFGDENFIASQRAPSQNMPGVSSSSERIDKSERVSQLEQQLANFELDLRKKGQESEGLRRRLLEFEDELARYRAENTTLKEQLRRGLPTDQTSLNMRNEQLIHENGNLKGDVEFLNNKCSDAEKSLRIQTDKLASKTQELQQLVNQYDSLRLNYERTMQERQSQPQGANQSIGGSGSFGQHSSFGGQSPTKAGPGGPSGGPVDQSVVKELESRIVTLTSKNTSLENSLRNHEQENSKLQDQIRQMKNASPGILGQGGSDTVSKQQLDQLRDEGTFWKNKSEALEKQLASAGKEIEQYRYDYENVKKKLQESESKEQNLAKKVQDLQSENADLSERVGRIRRESMSPSPSKKDEGQETTELRRAIDEQQSEVSKMRQSMSQLESDNARANQIINDNKETASTNQDKIRSLENTIQDLQAKLRAQATGSLAPEQRNIVRELEDELNRFRAKEAALANTVKQLEKSNDQLQKEISEMNASSQKMNSDLQAENKDLMSSLDKIRMDMISGSSVRSNVMGSTPTKGASAGVDPAQLMQVVESQQRDLGKLRGVIQSLEQENLVAIRKVKDSDEDLRRNQATIRQLEETIAEIKAARRASATQNLDPSAQSIIGELESQLSQASAKIKTLGSKSEEQAAQIAQLKDKLKEATDREDKAISRTNDIQNNASALMADMDKLRGDTLSRVSQSSDGSSPQVMQLTTIIEGLQGELDRLRATASTMEQQLFFANKKAKEAKDDLLAAQDKAKAQDEENNALRSLSRTKQSNIADSNENNNSAGLLGDRSVKQNQRVKQLEAEIATLKERAELSAQDKQAVERKILDLEAANRELTNSVDQIRRSAISGSPTKGISGSIAPTDPAQLRQIISDQQTEVERLRTNIQQLEKDRDGANKKFRDTKEDLIKEQDKVRSLEDTLNDQRNKSTSPQKSQQSLPGQTIPIEPASEGVQKDLSKKAGEVAALKEEVKRLQAKLKSSDDQLDNLMKGVPPTRVAEMEKQNLKAQADQLAQKIAQAEAEKATIKQDLENLTTNNNFKIGSLNQTVQRLEESNKQLENRVGDLLAPPLGGDAGDFRSNQMGQEVAHWKAKTQGLEDRINDEKRMNTIAAKEIESLKGRIEQGRDRERQLESKILDLQNTIGEQTETIDRYRKEALSTANSARSSVSDIRETIPLTGLMMSTPEISQLKRVMQDQQGEVERLRNTMQKQDRESQLADRKLKDAQENTQKAEDKIRQLEDTILDLQNKSKSKDVRSSQVIRISEPASMTSDAGLIEELKKQNQLLNERSKQLEADYRKLDSIAKDAAAKDEIANRKVIDLSTANRDLQEFVDRFRKESISKINIDPNQKTQTLTTTELSNMKAVTEDQKKEIERLRARNDQLERDQTAFAKKLSEAQGIMRDNEDQLSRSATKIRESTISQRDSIIKTLDPTSQQIMKELEEQFRASENKVSANEAAIRRKDIEIFDLRKSMREAESAANARITQLEQANKANSDALDQARLQILGPSSTSSGKGFESASIVADPSVLKQVIADQKEDIDSLRATIEKLQREVQADERKVKDAQAEAKQIQDKSMILEDKIADLQSKMRLGASQMLDPSSQSAIKESENQLSRSNEKNREQNANIRKLEDEIESLKQTIKGYIQKEDDNSKRADELQRSNRNLAQSVEKMRKDIYTSDSPIKTGPDGGASSEVQLKRIIEELQTENTKLRDQMGQLEKKVTQSASNPRDSRPVEPASADRFGTPVKQNQNVDELLQKIATLEQQKSLLQSQLIQGGPAEGRPSLPSTIKPMQISDTKSMLESQILGDEIGKLRAELLRATMTEQKLTNSLVEVQQQLDATSRQNSSLQKSVGDLNSKNSDLTNQVASNVPISSADLLKENQKLTKEQGLNNQKLFNMEMELTKANAALKSLQQDNTRYSAQIESLKIEASPKMQVPNNSVIELENKTLAGQIAALNQEIMALRGGNTDESVIRQQLMQAIREKTQLEGQVQDSNKELIKKDNEAKVEIGRLGTKIESLEARNKLLQDKLDQSSPKASGISHTSQPIAGSNTQTNMSSENANLKQENQGMKMLIDELNEQIVQLNQDLKKSLSSSSNNRGTSPLPPPLFSSDSKSPENEVLRLKEEVSDLTLKNKKNESIIAELNDHVSTLTIQLAKPQRSNVPGGPVVEDKLARENRELKEQIEQLKSSFERLQKGSDSLKSIPTSPMKVEDILGAKPPSSSGASGDVQSQISELNSTIKSMSDDHAKKMIQMLSDLDEKNKKIALLSSEVQGLYDAIDKANQGKALPSSLQPDLIGKLKSLTEENAMLTEKVQTLEKSLARQKLIGTSKPVVRVTEAQSEQILDAFQQLRRFDQIKKVIESQNPGTPFKIDVTKNKDSTYTIDIEPAIGDGQTIDKLPKKRITIPEHMFDQLKDVKIETNSDEYGRVQPETMYRHTFVEGNRVTEVISAIKPEGQTMESATKSEQRTTIPKDLADFFSLGSGKDAEMKEKSGFIVEKKVESDLGKDFQLIQTLIAPSFAHEHIEGMSTKNVIKVERFASPDKSKSSESVMIVDSGKLKERQAQRDEQLMNDLITELANPQAALLQSSMIAPGSNEFVYRLVPAEESRNSTMEIQKIKLPIRNPAAPEIVQRITVQGVTHPAEDTTDTKAIIRIEGAGEGQSKSVQEFNFKKGPDGNISLSRRPSQEVDKARLIDVSKKPSEKSIAEMKMLQMLMKDPNFMSSRTETGVLKITQGEDGVIKVETIDKAAGRRNSTASEKISVDPNDIETTEDTISFKRERIEDGNLIKEKVSLDDRGKSKVKTLGFTNLASYALQDGASRQKLADLENQLTGLSEQMQKEVVPAISDQGVGVNRQLQELLYTIVPAADLNTSKPIMLRSKIKDGNLIIERFRVVNEPGEVHAPGIVVPQVGLVSSRVIVHSFSEEGATWKITRVSDQKGRVQTQQFEINRLPPGSLANRFTQPSEEKNLITERAVEDSQKINIEGSTVTYLDQFTVPKQNARGLRDLSTNASKIPQIILQAQNEDELLLEKYNVPVPGNCFIQLVDRIKFNLAGRTGTRTQVEPNGIVIQEFSEDPANPGEPELLNRVVIGGVSEFQDLQNTVNLRDQIKINPEDIFRLIESQPNKKVEQVHNDQRIIRERLVGGDKITEDFVVPFEPDYDLVLPNCLAKYEVSIRDRVYGDTTAKAIDTRDTGLVASTLQVMGGLENLKALLSKQEDRGTLQNVFSIAGQDKDGVLIETFEVKHGPGSIYDNLKLIERIIISSVKSSPALENVEVMKETFSGTEIVVRAIFKLSKTEGVPLPLEGIKKLFVSSETLDKQVKQRPQLLKNLQGENEIGKFLRILFETHELGSSYVIVRGKEGEYRRIDTEGPNFRTTELLKIASTAGNPMNIVRLIHDGDQSIKEEIAVLLPSEIDGPKSKMIVPQMSSDTLSKAMLRIKKKVKVAKEAEGSNVRQNPDIDDVLDYLAKQKIPGELQDLIHLGFDDKFSGLTPGRKKINIFESGMNLSALKTIEVDSLRQPQIKTVSELKPALVLKSEIKKLSGARTIVDMFRTTMIEETIISADSTKKEELRKAEYMSVIKSEYKPTAISETTYAIVPNPTTGVPEFKPANQRDRTLSPSDKESEALKLSRYLDLVVSLLNNPEVLLRPNSILLERTQGDKLMIDRVDILNMQDTNGALVPHALLREELVFHKDIMDAILSQPSSSIRSSTAQLLEQASRGFGQEKNDRLVVKRTTITNGIVMNDIIKIDFKNGEFNNSIIQRNTAESKPVTEAEARYEEKVPDNLALVLRYAIENRKKESDSAKLLCCIEAEGDEVSVSSIVAHFVEKSDRQDPLSYSINDYALIKQKKIAINESDGRYNFLLGGLESVECNIEMAEIGSKVKINTTAIKSDLTEQVSSSFTLPRVADWETNLTLGQLCKIFSRASDQLKMDHFVRRRIQNGKIVYELVKFESDNSESRFLVSEQMVFDKDPFQRGEQPRERGTFMLTEDDLYSKMMKKPTDQPQNSERQQNPKTDRDRPGLFESVMVRSEEGSGNVPDDESIVEVKNLKTLPRLGFEAGRETNPPRPILIPIVAALKAIEDMKLSPEEKKDTVLVERMENRKCIFELVKVKTAPGKPTQIEPIARIVTPAEMSVFGSMELSRVKFDQSNRSKIEDLLKVNPDNELSITSTAKTTFSSDPAAYDPSFVTVADVLGNLTRYLEKMKKQPMYLSVINDGNDYLMTEAVEIMGKKSEVVRETVEINKKPKMVTPLGRIYEVKRSQATPEGQSIEVIDYLKSNDPTKTAATILDAKLEESKPKKPYKNNDRERERAEDAGIQPRRATAAVDIEQVLDMFVRNTDERPSVVSQHIEGGKKVIVRRLINPETNKLELIERYILDLDDSNKVGPKLSLTNLAQYLIKPEAAADGGMKVKILQLVDKENKGGVDTIMSRKLSDDETKQWRNISLVNEENNPKDPGASSIKPPVGFLEIKEVELDRFKNVEKEVNPLGEVIGYTIDGQPIFRKQLKDQATDPSGAGGNLGSPSKPQQAGTQSKAPQKTGDATPGFKPMGNESFFDRPNPAGQPAFEAPKTSGIPMFDSGLMEEDHDTKDEPTHTPSNIDHGPNPYIRGPSQSQLVTHPIPGETSAKELATYYRSQLGQALDNDDLRTIIRDCINKLDSLGDSQPSVPTFGGKPSEMASSALMPPISGAKPVEPAGKVDEQTSQRLLIKLKTLQEAGLVDKLPTDTATVTIPKERLELLMSGLDKAMANRNNPQKRSDELENSNSAAGQSPTKGAALNSQLMAHPIPASTSARELANHYRSQLGQPLTEGDMRTIIRDCLNKLDTVGNEESNIPTSKITDPSMAAGSAAANVNYQIEIEKLKRQLREKELQLTDMNKASEVLQDELSTARSRMSQLERDAKPQAPLIPGVKRIDPLADQMDEYFSHDLLKNLNLLKEAGFIESLPNETTAVVVPRERLDLLLRGLKKALLERTSQQRQLEDTQNESERVQKRLGVELAQAKHEIGNLKSRLDEVSASKGPTVKLEGNEGARFQQQQIFELTEKNRSLAIQLQDKDQEIARILDDLADLKQRATKREKMIDELNQKLLDTLPRSISSAPQPSSQTLDRSMNEEISSKLRGLVEKKLASIEPTGILTVTIHREPLTELLRGLEGLMKKNDDLAKEVAGFNDKMKDTTSKMNQIVLDLERDLRDSKMQSEMQINEINNLNQKLTQADAKANNLTNQIKEIKVDGSPDKLIKARDVAIDDLNRENERLRDDSKKLKDRLSELDTKILLIGQEREDAKREAREAKAAVPDVKPDLQLNADIESTLRNIDDKGVDYSKGFGSGSVAAPADKVGSLVKAANALLQAQDSAQKQLKTYQSELAAANDKLASAGTDASREVDSWKMKTDSLQRDVNALRSQLEASSSTADKQIQALQNKAVESERVFKDKDAELRELKAESDNRREELRVARDKIAELETKMISLNSELARRQEKDKTMVAEEKLDPTTEADLFRVSGMMIDKGLADPTSFTADKKRVSVPAKEFSDLLRGVAKLNELKDRADRDLKDVKDSLADNINKLNLTSAQLQKDTETLKQRLDAAQADAIEQKRLKNDAENALQQTRRDLDYLRDDKTAEQALKSKENQLLEAKKEIETIRDENKNLKNGSSQIELKLLEISEDRNRLKLDVDRLRGAKPEKDLSLSAELARVARLLEDKKHMDSVIPDGSLATVERDVLAAVLRAVAKLLEASDKQAQQLKYTMEDVGALNERMMQVTAANDREKEAVRRKLDEREEELKQARKDKGDRDIALDRLRLEMDSMKNDRTTENALRSKENENERLKGEIESQRFDIKNLKDRIAQLEVQVLTSGQERDKLRTEKSKIPNVEFEDVNPVAMAETERLISTLAAKRVIDPLPIGPMNNAIPASMFSNMHRGLAALLASYEKQLQELKVAQQIGEASQARADEAERKAKTEEARAKDERDRAEKLREAKDRIEKDAKRKEDDLQRRLERTVDVDKVQELSNKHAADIEDKKNNILNLEREIANLKHQIDSRDLGSKALEEEIAQKSNKVIQLESLKTKLEEAEDEKRRIEARNLKTVEGINEENKALRQEIQRQRMIAEASNTRNKELEARLSKIQEDMSERKRPAESDNLNDTIRSQTNLISTMRDRESRTDLENKKLQRDIENLEREFEIARAEAASRAKFEGDLNRQILEMYDQMDKLSQDLTAKQREIIEANKETDSWKQKLSQFKLGVESAQGQGEMAAKIKLTQLEIDLDKCKRSETDLSARLNDVQNELRSERSKRHTSESELESGRRELVNLAKENDSLRSNNKQLLASNMEMNQRLLTFNTNADMDNKFYNLEDEMQRLKFENDDLNRKIKDLNDDMKSSNNRDRSLSRENSELKNKIKSEKILRIKEEQSHKDRESQREMELRRNRTEASLQPTISMPDPHAAVVDYGPVFDLKMKNMALQQEINQLKHRMSEIDYKEKRDQSMLNLLKTQELKEVMKYNTDQQGQEFPDEMMISMRGSPMKQITERSSMAIVPEEYMTEEVGKLRDKVSKLNSENEGLKNQVSMLKSDLITVAHNRIPPDMTTPYSSFSLTISGDKERRHAS